MTTHTQQQTALPDAEAPDTRLGGASLDIAAEKRRELFALFPEVRTEDGQIDFERLRLALGDSVEIGKERYGLTWPGKAECFKTIQARSMATLLPAPGKSVNFDTTENVIVEGDNLEALKLLQKSYLGKIKMIYIDPPYNTGNDFIYPDNYSESLKTYLQYTGQIDTGGERFGTNTDTEGRFHSKWLNMMYPRLYLARDLLCEDGILFASINDVEFKSMLSLCDEIFGEDNRLAVFVWLNEGNIDNQSKVKVNHEYVVAYARDQSALRPPPVIDPNIPRESKLYRDYIENTIVKNGPANPESDITLPAGFPASFEDGVIEPKSDSWPRLSSRVRVAAWRTTEPVVARSGWSSRDLLEQFIRSDYTPLKDTKGQETTFYINPSGTIMLRKRRSESQSHVLTVLRGMGTVQSAASALATLGIDFPYPKPTSLMEYLVRIGSQDGIVMDFFAGSGTIGEAVLRLNSACATARKFILVQLPEPTSRSDYPTVADICEERVRRVIRQLDDADTGKLDMGDTVPQDRGFRVFRLAESNVKEWDAGVSHDVDALKEQLELGVDHLVPGRTDLDIVYEVLLKSGYLLSAKISTDQIAGKRVYSVAAGAFLICLERKLSLDLIRAIAARSPERVLCLDEGFAGNDQLKTNAVQTFKGKNITFRTL